MLNKGEIKIKLKQSKGMSLIVFIIILAVLVVVAGGVIVYLLNNPVKENVAVQNTSSVQNNVSNNGKTEEKNELVNATALKKYILGKDLAGRNFEEILNDSAEISTFIDEKSTISNA